MSANEMPERHADTERNMIINRASYDLDQIINGHDPEIHHLGNRVWDRLDKMAVDIENHRSDLCASGQQVRALVEWAADIFRNCTVTDGCCCCGDNMEGHPHPMSAGHSPVDHGSYVADKWLKAYAAMEKEQGE